MNTNAPSQLDLLRDRPPGLAHHSHALVLWRSWSSHQLRQELCCLPAQLATPSRGPEDESPHMAIQSGQLSWETGGVPGATGRKSGTFMALGCVSVQASPEAGPSLGPTGKGLFIFIYKYPHL